MQKFSSRLARTLRVVNRPLKNKGLSKFHFVLKILHHQRIARGNFFNVRSLIVNP